MQTELMCDARAAAWLECDSPSGSAPKKISLKDGPFCLGRGESADLPVNSTRVSREHAVIERCNGQWRVRDLHSTNGTFVNGERIDEAPLSDGDVLKVADTEFHFHVEQDASGLVTQCMTEGPSHGSRSGVGEWVRGVRRMREALLRGGGANRYVPLVRLETRNLFAYESLDEADFGPARAIDKRIIATECLLSERLREVQRLAAIEDTAALPVGVRLVVRLAAAEVGARRLLDTCDLLAGQAGERPLIAALPVSAVCDTPAYRDWLQEMRARRIGVLYDQFSGGGAVAALEAAVAPDYVKLSPALVQGVEQSSDRRRQIQAVVRTCQEVGCQTIAAGVDHATTANACRELGCTFAQGDYFPSAADGRAVVR